MQTFTPLLLLTAALILPAALSAQDCDCVITKSGQSIQKSSGCDDPANLCSLTVGEGLGNIDLSEFTNLTDVRISIGDQTNCTFEGTSITSSGTQFVFPEGGTNIKVMKENGHKRTISYNNGGGYNVEAYNMELVQCPSICTLNEPSRGGVMPVSLLWWRTSATDRHVELQWETAEEVDNNYFVVAHSTNGRNFQDVATLLGRGTTEVISAYRFSHQPIASGVHYYRITQVDYDGTTTELGVQSVEWKSGLQQPLSVSPNPVSSGMTLRIADGETADGLAAIYDPAGRKIGTYPISNTRIALPRLTAGVYTLHLRGQVTRFVVTP